MQLASLRLAADSPTASSLDEKGLGEKGLGLFSG